MDRASSYLHRLSPNLGRPSDVLSSQQRSSNMASNNPYGSRPKYAWEDQLKRNVDNHYNRLNGLSTPQRSQQPQTQPQPPKPRGSQRGPLAQISPDGRGIQQRSLNPGSVRILQRPSMNQSNDLKSFILPAQQATQRLNQQPATKPQQNPLLAPPSRAARPAVELPSTPVAPAARLAPSALPRAAAELPPTPPMSTPAAPASASKDTLIIVYKGCHVLIAKPPTFSALKHFVADFFDVNLNTRNLKDLRPFVCYPHPLNGSVVVDAEIHESAYDGLRDREQVFFAFRGDENAEHRGGRGLAGGAGGLGGSTGGPASGPSGGSSGDSSGGSSGGSSSDSSWGSWSFSVCSSGRLRQQRPTPTVEDNADTGKHEGIFGLNLELSASTAQQAGPSQQQLEVVLGGRPQRDPSKAQLARELRLLQGCQLGSYKWGDHPEVWKYNPGSFAREA